MLKIFVVALVLATVVTAAAPKWHQLSKEYTFEKYFKDFQKPYVPGSIEWFQRKELFEAKLKEVISHNADKTQTYKRGVNRFSDYTTEEIDAQLMFKQLRKMSREGKLPQSPPTATETIVAHKKNTKPNLKVPPSVDYRNAVPAVLTTVKDQGACGSCWSFSTAEGIETHTAINKGALHVLSEQNLVSCVPNITVSFENQTFQMHGCDGYLPNAALEYLVSTGGGISTEWMMPYTSYWDQIPNMPQLNPKACNALCPPVPQWVNTGCPKATYVTGYTAIAINDPGVFEQTLAFQGPLSIVMFVPDVFMDYEHGVFQTPSCVGNPNMQPSHAVLMVGYGYDADLNLDYWIVRNSWSEDWGEKGYFRILKESNGQPVCGNMPLPSPSSNTQWVNQTACGTCGVLAYAIYPQIGDKP